MKQLFSRDKWKYAFYTVSHPSDGYYEIRHRERGSVPIAILLVILFSLSFSINRIHASFIVNDVDPLDVSALTELVAVLLLYLLFCISNWSITCLMEGEGRLKDISIAVGYAMLPLIFGYNLATIVSQAVAQNEEAFYFMILGIGIAYGLFMILIGIMQVHTGQNADYHFPDVYCNVYYHFRGAVVYRSDQPGVQLLLQHLSGTDIQSLGGGEHAEK